MERRKTVDITAAIESLPEFAVGPGSIRAFSEELAAQRLWELARWPAGVRCVACDKSTNICRRPRGTYRCGSCFTDFSIRTGTVMERSHVPLHKWLYCLYVLLSSQNRIPTLRLANRLGVTYVTARLMLSRLQPVDIVRNISGFYFGLMEAVDAVLKYRPIQKARKA